MNWTTSSLQGLIAELRLRQGDTASVEVKSALDGVPELSDTLCAFANMPEGGTIILGLDEAAGFVPVGLRNVAALEQAVAAKARTSVTPPVRCEFQTFQVAGQPVLVVAVEALPLQQRPARHGGQAYLRQSDGDYVMSEQEIAQIELLKTQSVSPTRPDRQAVPYTSVDDLDPDLLAGYLGAARRSSRRYATLGDEDVLRRTGVLARTGEATLAGIYALGVSPQTVSPSLGVTAAVRLPRGAGERTRDLTHLVGPIPDLLDDALAWVLRNTRTSMGYDERGHGIDRPELPMNAVREIVANALVHRNLDAITDSKRVEIRLLDDRLIVTSPGGLWGVSEAQLGRPGAKSAVNPVLYDICRNVRMPDGSRVIEGEGGGIQEAVEALQVAGLRPPRFVDTGVQCTAIIFRPTMRAEDPRPRFDVVRPSSSPTVALSPTTRNGDAVLAALAEPRPLAEIVAATGLTEGQVRYALSRLLASGEVVMHGAQGVRRTAYARAAQSPDIGSALMRAAQEAGGVELSIPERSDVARSADL